MTMEMQLTLVLFLQYRSDFVLFSTFLFPSFKLTLPYTSTRNKILQSHIANPMDSCQVFSASAKGGQKPGQERKHASLYLLPIPDNMMIAIALYLGSSVTSRFQDAPLTHTHFSRLSLLSSFKTTSTTWLSIPSQKPDFSSVESLPGASNAQEPATDTLPLHHPLFRDPLSDSISLGFCSEPLRRSCSQAASLSPRDESQVCWPTALNF